MKKLLGILGTITIAGSGISGILGNALVPAKNEINYLQTNNLKQLKRNKRSDNIKTNNIDVNYDAKEYFKNLCSKVLKKLLDNGVIRSISDSNGSNVICDTNYYVINPNNNINHFTIPFYVNDQDETIELVFRVRDFYLEGFTYNAHFYHFSDSELTRISGQTSHNLNFESNYNNLITGNPTINWSGITQAFNDLINYAQNLNIKVILT